MLIFDHNFVLFPKATKDKKMLLFPVLFEQVRLVSDKNIMQTLYDRGLQPAARRPPAALRRVLCGPAWLFHKIQCVMKIEA